MSRYEQRREYLINQLMKMKNEGFRVFINRNDSYGFYNYGLITDGKDIVYIQFDE